MGNRWDMNLVICDGHMEDGDFDKLQVILFDSMESGNWAALMQSSIQAAGRRQL